MLWRGIIPGGCDTTVVRFPLLLSLSFYCFFSFSVHVGILCTLIYRAVGTLGIGIPKKETGRKIIEVLVHTSLRLQRNDLVLLCLLNIVDSQQGTLIQNAPILTIVLVKNVQQDRISTTQLSTSIIHTRH